MPIETLTERTTPPQTAHSVAFTPKGGCPLKHKSVTPQPVRFLIGSIHPQGWVPIETLPPAAVASAQEFVAFTPKGGCPLKRVPVVRFRFPNLTSSIHPQGWVPIETGGTGNTDDRCSFVAFTPKGGCPLKHRMGVFRDIAQCFVRSIHPQGWVPIETGYAEQRVCEVRCL